LACLSLFKNFESTNYLNGYESLDLVSDWQWSNFDQKNSFNHKSSSKAKIMEKKYKIEYKELSKSTGGVVCFHLVLRWTSGLDKFKGALGWMDKSKELLGVDRWLG
jgi:hypothetical protein